MNILCSLFLPLHRQKITDLISTSELIIPLPNTYTDSHKVYLLWLVAFAQYNVLLQVSIVCYYFYYSLLSSIPICYSEFDLHFFKLIEV